MNDRVTLRVSEGVEISMSAPACHPPAGIALWGNLAFVLVNPETRLYQEAKVVRVPGHLEDAQIAADIAESLTL